MPLHRMEEFKRPRTCPLGAHYSHSVPYYWLSGTPVPSPDILSLAFGIRFPSSSSWEQTSPQQHICPRLNWGHCKGEEDKVGDVDGVWRLGWDVIRCAGEASWDVGQNYRWEENSRPGLDSSALSHSIKKLQGIQNSKLKSGFCCLYEHSFKQDLRIRCIHVTLH